MAGIAKEWNMYQVSKALLRRDQQKILSLCENILYHNDGNELRTIMVSNDTLNQFRGEKYTPEQNQRFLNELAEVNLYTKDKLTAQNPFDTVKYLNEDKKFKIAFSDYFFNNIGEFVRNSTKVGVQR